MTSKKSSRDAAPVGDKGQGGTIKSDAKKTFIEAKSAKKIVAVKETKLASVASEPAKTIGSSGTDHSSKTSETKSAATAKVKSSMTTDEPKRSKLSPPVKRFQLFKRSTRTKSLAIAAAPAAQKSTTSEKIADHEAATMSHRKVEIVKKVKKSSSTKAKKSGKSTKSVRDVSKSSKKASKKSAAATPPSEEYH
uniref:Uncharacterized protein n=1 Tax=Romanomermis culicivorax TaxID=13658 RepID=A0A915HMW5_ROMCU